MFSIYGKIVEVSEPQSGVSANGNAWKKQECVIEEVANKTFLDKFAFRVFGEDKIAEMNIKKGENITLNFAIRSRNYNGKWYTDIDAISIERVVHADAILTTQNKAQAQQPTPQTQTAQPVAPATITPQVQVQPQVSQQTQPSASDDLPF